MLAGKGALRAGRGSKESWSGFLMPSHPLTNFDIPKYYEKEPKFNSPFSMNNFPKMKKDEAYVIDLDQY